ncbi:anthranilate phosphoribosyltransferase [Trueperella sp. LYQ143]|uniref:anthranilate phosphoribosyltransferase n=1 Tax=Trueperella sp. LYQ143 TaxID=3391059 RepID=UPI003983B6A1
MSSLTWPDITTRLMSRHDLSSDETAWAMDQVMTGQTSPVVLAGFLTALATKGETTEELLGLANSMQAHAARVDLSSDSLDIVGTGGDRLRTVNISTTASLVIAAAGVRVVKHGNRASSSKSGSADCLEALGVDLDLPIDAVEEVFRQLGITFLFATKFHPSMKYAAQARRELAVPTAFNVLGPLTNPAKPESSAIGVSNPAHAPLVAGVLSRRGNRALVFRGENGMDEMSAICPNHVWEVREGAVTEHRFDAVAELGIAQASVDDLRGQDAEYNAAVTRNVVRGERSKVREAVSLNAAAAFVADGRLPGLEPHSGSFAQRMQRGFALAEQTIDCGAANDLLERWVQLSQELAADSN